MRQPLSAAEARKLAREILVQGTVSFTKHCLKELGKDGKSTVDATNVFVAARTPRLNGKMAPGAIGPRCSAWPW